MKAYPAAALVSFAAAAAVVFAALAPPTLPVAQAQVQTPNRVRLQALYAQKCSACHDLPNPVEKNYTRPQWRRVVNQMINKYKATDITPTDAEQIIGYLALFSPPVGRASRVPNDPWATDETDVWTVAPSATHVFNFEAANPLTLFAPLTAGVAGPAAVWHSVPGTTADGTVVKVSPAASPSSSRFALLLDRADTGRNIDVKVRFQIQGGAVSPSVGIAFGLSGPKSYDVLRYDALHDTLSLMKFDNTAHTTLQQNPVAVPNDTKLVSVANPMKLSDGWHTLRLLVNHGQIRGWVDRVKRISTQDAAYAGGQVGLWTQGDTVAVFDDWTVDLYDAPPPAAVPANVL